MYFFLNCNLGCVIGDRRLYGPRRVKPCHRGFANNTGAYQPALPRKLISTFVIRLLESIISRLAAGHISIFLLVSVAEETGLSLALSETQKPCRPNCDLCSHVSEKYQPHNIGIFIEEFKQELSQMSIVIWICELLPQVFSLGPCIS